MKSVVFHPEAHDEFAAAISFYGKQADGLGDRFYDEILKLTAEIEAAPQLFRMWRNGTRRHLGQQFPYALIYVERPAQVVVPAVAHAKRKPGYWKHRLA